ncbi:B-cell receptor CD22 isoform X1 [Babesia caballi]|uniref:B-cell receptor CD22 isoform X1 n=1 Tax=Babesia caballi TaxID=5871 RepID=A0AAV4M1W4_BABCB|nr:B-cell receptor CD22 isoform X1 [Babesia caballi]
MRFGDGASQQSGSGRETTGSDRESTCSELPPPDRFASPPHSTTSEDVPLHTLGDTSFKASAVGSFHTIYDSKADHGSCGQGADSASNWLQRKLDKAMNGGQSLPMYKTHDDSEVINKDGDFAGRTYVPKLNRRVRRILSIVFFVIVTVVAFNGSIKFFNWVEDRRHAQTEDVVMRDVEFLRLKQTVDAMRIELNKLKEAAYANSVAINGITNGVFKLPGADDAPAKKLKFGKNKPAINQGAVSQNFDTRQFATALGAQPKGTLNEVDLNPIVHDADIR